MNDDMTTAVFILILLSSMFIGIVGYLYFGKTYVRCFREKIVEGQHVEESYWFEYERMEF